MRRYIFVTIAIAIATVVTATTGIAEAQQKQKIVALSFGGKGGKTARRLLVRKLSRSYDVRPGDELLDACDELGIAVSRGPNLGRCARQVGAFAVVGGRVAKRRLELAVYAAATGEPAISGSIAWSRRPSRRQIAKATQLANEGLSKAADLNAASPDDPVTQGGDSGVIDASGAVEVGGVQQPPTAPQPQTGGSGGGGSDLDEWENPLAPTQRPPQPARPPSSFTSSIPAAATRFPYVSGTVGIGAWFRQFSFKRPIETAPRYDSGAAFTLRTELFVRPAAFFSEGFVTNVFLRAKYQKALGLESQVDSETAGVGALPTTMSELVVDFGYHWQILDEFPSPYLDMGIGFGLFDFAVEWTDPMSQALPDMSYQFANISVLGSYPINAHLSGFIEGYYRYAFSAGEINNDTSWYGPSSNQGFGGRVGINIDYKRVVGYVHYEFTQYSITFSEKTYTRSQADKKAAAGATDQYHGLMLGVGYSY